MADPNRPPAPFLPPEIVTQIIHSTPPESYPLIARINSTWTAESQYQLFKAVTIHSFQALRLLIPILESQNRLARMIKYACIRPRDKDTEDDYNYIQAGLTLRFFSTMKGLEKLKFKSFEYFSAKERAILFGESLLPALVTLELETSHSEWNARTFECIIATAPNIESFRFETYNQSHCSNDDPLPRWKAYPKKLKKLYLNCPRPFMEGTIWPLKAFRGLEVLNTYKGTFSNDFGEAKDFFEVVAPTLREVSLFEEEELGIGSYLAAMVVLEKIEGPTIDNPRFFIELPKSVKIIGIDWDTELADLKEALETYYTSGKNHLSFTHFRTTSLNFSTEEYQLNLAHIPTTQTLVCEDEFNILDSLDQLKVGEVKFKELVLRREYFENEGIRNRCRELGIELKEWADKYVSPPRGVEVIVISDSD